MSKHFIRWILPLAVIGLQAADSSQPSIGVNGVYLVGPGDVLRVTVFEVEELSNTVVVSPKGTISPPLIEEFSVAGITAREIEAKLEQMYEGGYLRDPQISVVVSEFRSQPVSVLGAVERPGVYQLQGRRRLLEVLAMSGGLGKDVGDTITISRRPGGSGARPAAGSSFTGPGSAMGEPAPAASGQEIEVSVRNMLLRPDSDDANPLIQPHDVIQVSKAGIVYVMGAVEKAGGYTIKDQEKITVLRAVSLASGLGRHASPQKARIIREVDGKKQWIHVRIKDVIAGRSPDPELAANDILYIPDSRAKSVLSRSVEAMIQVGTGVAIFRR